MEFMDFILIGFLAGIMGYLAGIHAELKKLNAKE
jgi:hypothetical protein